MTNATTVRNLIVRVLALAIGILFPFVSVPWKIVILAGSLLFRAVDSEKDKTIFGAAPLFFIGIILAYLYIYFLQ